MLTRDKYSAHWMTARSGESRGIALKNFYTAGVKIKSNVSL